MKVPPLERLKNIAAGLRTSKAMYHARNATLRQMAVEVAQEAYADGVPMEDICKAIGVNRIALAKWATALDTTISGRKQRNG